MLEKLLSFKELSKYSMNLYRGSSGGNITLLQKLALIWAKKVNKMLSMLGKSLTYGYKMMNF